MDKKVIQIHPEAEESNREVPHIHNTGSKASIKVRQFKSRAQLALEEKNRIIDEAPKWLEEFNNKVLNGYLHGNMNLDFEFRQYLSNAITILGQTLYHVHANQKNNTRIFLSDMNDLTPGEQFQKTLTSFIIDPQDILNIKLIKKYLKRIIDMHGSDENETQDLLEYLDELLLATKTLIKIGYLEVDVSFYDKLMEN